MTRLLLKRGAEGRVKAGSLWVFSNELKNRGDAAGDGEVVEFSDSRGNFVGRGYYNSRTLIAGRLLTRDGSEAVDSDLFVRRLREAIAFRRRSYDLAPDDPDVALRLVHGEGDMLPGLVVDRYGPATVIQITTLGMMRWLDVVATTLIEMIRPQAVVLRTDVPYGDQEGLAPQASVIRGVLPDDVLFTVDDCHFSVDAVGGQKTGFYLDQRVNRLAVAELARGRRVLDVFTYTGAFAVYAARSGAEEVHAVDSSEASLARAEHNARLNAVADVVSFEKADAVPLLRRFAAEGRTFDMVILDPPPFARSRRMVPDALRGYREINLRALKLLKPGGVLVTCSCSHHVGRTGLLGSVADAAADAGVRARVIGWGQQSGDHPVLLGMPETEYLTCTFVEVC